MRSFRSVLISYSYARFAEYGEIEDMVLVDNTADHMCGNVLVRYREEESAKKMMEVITI